MLRTVVLRWRDTLSNSPSVMACDGNRSWEDLAREIDNFTEQLQSLHQDSLSLAVLPQTGATVPFLVACEMARRDVILVSKAHAEVAGARFIGESSADQIITIDGSKIVTVSTCRPRRPRDRAIGEPSVFILTSGTTGAPKCVRHTWGTLSSGIRDIKPADHADYRWMIGYSLVHLGGLRLIAYCLSKGITIVLPSDFSPYVGMKTLVESQSHGIACTPSYIRRMLFTFPVEEWSKSSVVHVSLGGEIADGHVLHALVNAIPGVKITHIYGSAETGAFTIVVSDGREGFDASVVDGIGIRIVDGELYIRRSPASGLGYLDGATQPAEWIATGDLVEVKEGRAKFAGRRDDVINVGGAKVRPVIVETVIREVSDVLDVTVSAQRSSILGNIVKATVHIREGANKDTVSSAIRSKCSAILPDYMVPRIVAFQNVSLNHSNKKLWSGTQ